MTNKKIIDKVLSDQFGNYKGNEDEYSREVNMIQKALELQKPNIKLDVTEAISVLERALFEEKHIDLKEGREIEDEFDLECLNRKFRFNVVYSLDYVEVYKGTTASGGNDPSVVDPVGEVEVLVIERI